LQNHHSLILKLPLIQIHFAKTTLGFSVITKIPFLLALSIFKSFTETHTSFTLTSTYFTLTNNMPSLQVIELSHPQVAKTGQITRQAVLNGGFATVGADWTTTW
jgi:hypothetical protein